jgi:hypothetical protein
MEIRISDAKIFVVALRRTPHATPKSKYRLLAQLLISNTRI